MARFAEWCPELEQALRDPFPEDAWEAFNKPVGDSRTVSIPYIPWYRYADRLDELVGPQGWALEDGPMKVIGSPARVVMPVRVTILGVTKAQVGEEEFERLDKESGIVEQVAGYGGPAIGAFAQGFKRACAMFGLGRREMYELPRERKRKGRARAQAARADGAQRPATSGQLRKIERLKAERQIPAAEIALLEARLSDDLTAAKASEIISHLQSLSRRAAGG